MPEGGQVRVSARLDPDQHGRLVRFLVADTGCGIGPEELTHIFERYWKARESNRTGSGLGLYIDSGIVQAHGGTPAGSRSAAPADSHAEDSGCLKYRRSRLTRVDRTQPFLCSVNPNAAGGLVLQQLLYAEEVRSIAGMRGPRLPALGTRRLLAPAFRTSAIRPPQSSGKKSTQSVRPMSRCCSGARSSPSGPNHLKDFAAGKMFLQC